ncbi:MAG: hypothetical protein IAE89_13695 [Anaerolineae bacterium]|nr:hypothetical protein [Anaerolineae bacterium]
MTQNWDVHEEVLLTDYLISQVCDRASGLLETECKHNLPSDKYFIGCLRPVPIEEDDTAPLYLRDLMNKLSPMAFGSEFRVLSTNNKITIQVQVTWTCYYRVFPSFHQQLEHQLNVSQDLASDEVIETILEGQSAVHEDELDSGDLIDDDSEDTEFLEDDISSTLDSSEDILTPPPLIANVPRKRRRSTIPKDSLAIRFKRIDCLAEGVITFSFDETTCRWVSDYSDLQTALDAETSRAQRDVRLDPERIHTGVEPELGVRVPEDKLQDEATYLAFCASLKTEVVPVWKWECRAEANSTAPETILLLTFTNRSVAPPKSKNVEPYLFATRAAFAFSEAQVLPFELELVPRSFRYDRFMSGKGFNCSVEYFEDRDIFITSNTPRHTQKRYSTRSQPTARFEDLANDPIPVLENILNAMYEELTDWEKAQEEYRTQFSDWDNSYAFEFEADHKLYINEIERFSRGVELIRENEDLYSAFKLTNETFRRAGTARGTSVQKTKSSWRLFQIVFLVTQIPAIAALVNPQSADAAERSIVDIIYFPTGGGKTEAYLGVIVFHCFFDRLRGKTAGVTAWTRFPLRLLTLQQTQRVADVIGVAELVRREQIDQRLSGKVAGFAVGYFAGKEATPNELEEPAPGQLPNPTWSKALDPKQRQNWKKVVICPSCGTPTVRLDFDPQKIRLNHHCTNRDCRFPEGRVPVYVVDNEIYRYLPSVIVGTIDKLASVGNQRKLSLVFGQVDGRCPEHGYYKGVCCQKGCKERLQPGVSAGISGPTLFVQDELHLLKEGLGTFDAHYETFTQELLRLTGQELPLKIIASSATIEAFERQIEHLYGRERQQARIFPGNGARLSRSFYAETYDYPQRIFVGIIPHNKTLFNAVLELIQYYHEAIQNLQRLGKRNSNPYGGETIPGTATWAALVDYYATSLNYFISGRDLNSLRTDLDTVVSEDMRKQGFYPLEIAELTGGTSSDAVTKILEQLETQTPSPGSAPTTVLATNMVSHGVDVDRFNSMIFYGMPRQNAEYIQASSRVGRSHVGIIFNCLNPARERDQSHYSYFSKFHEFLGRLVEPVAINRWSKFSIQRTLPGLFVGILLQRIANQAGVTKPNSYYLLDFVKREISSRRLQANDFVPLLEAAYRVEHPTTIGEQVFRDEIRLRVQQFLDQILYASNQHTFVSDALKPYKPMSSLREVDEQLEIELDKVGKDWANTRKQRK